MSVMHYFKVSIVLFFQLKLVTGDMNVEDQAKIKKSMDCFL